MSPRPRILCMVDLRMAPEAIRILDAACDVDHFPSDRTVLLERIGQYDAFWGHFDLQVGREVLQRGTRLKVVNTATTGTDHIDKAEAARRGVKVLCIARDTALLDTFTATAELAWMLLLACARHFREAGEAALKGDWDGRRFVGRQLSGMTLGVLGVGRLGRMSIEYGKAFRMCVLACDPKPFDITGVQRVDLDTLLRESDAVLIHIHLTPETRHLFDREVLSRMKADSILVNTSRGDIVDEEALLDALESGRLAAFGADVLHDEWRGTLADQPLVRYAREHPNVVLTPHIGGATHKSVIDARVFSARKLVHYLQTGEELSKKG